MSKRLCRRIIASTGVAVALAWTGGDVDAGQNTAPTFTKDVAPILYKNCVRCHRRGEVAPMPLMTYEEARPWARAIKEKVIAREMPPWFADPAYGRFRNDARLSREEIETIAAWAEAGSPKGEDADLPPPPQFAAGWLHPQGLAPNYIIEMPLDYQAPAEGEIPMLNFYTPVPFQEDRFAEALQVVPGNRTLAHHGLLYVRKLPSEVRVKNGVLVNAQTGEPVDRERPEPGTNEAEPGTNEAAGRRVERAQNVFDTEERIWLGVYAPGWFFERYVPGVGKRLPVGWHVQFNMHYQPTGKPETDRTRVGLWFQKAVTRELRTQRIGETHVVSGAELLAARAGTRARIPNIPPYADDWAITGITSVPEPITIYSLVPHMHLRGKDMAYLVTYPDGREETLLSVPRYDFNWQLVYELAEPVHLPAGSKITTVGHFDNSLKNRYNPAPDREVYWAEQSWDEMFNGFIFYTKDNEAPRKAESQ